MITNKDRSKKSSANIMGLLSLQTMFVIFASIISFMFVEYASRTFWGNSAEYNILGHAFGLIIPMCVLVGAVNFYLSKIFLRCVSTLIEGIGKIAGGNFATRLDLKKSGPLSEVYNDFNKMGEELENVEMLKNDFLNNYSHEFKTPITSINGFASLLLETNVTEEERTQYLKIIAYESARLTELANSTILMSKLDSQAIVHNKKTYSLDEQLRQCAIITSADWQNKNINFSEDLQSVNFYGNAELMQHLWLNLFCNAIKYTPCGGDVTVSLAQTSTAIIVSVSDSGIGMSSDELSHIFDKYYQTDKSHNKQGLGLGLAIAKRVTELNRGTLAVTSSPNAGSTFTVTLPLN